MGMEDRWRYCSDGNDIRPASGRQRAFARGTGEGALQPKGNPPPATRVLMQTASKWGQHANAMPASPPPLPVAFPSGQLNGSTPSQLPDVLKLWLASLPCSARRWEESPILKQPKTITFLNVSNLSGFLRGKKSLKTKKRSIPNPRD